MSNGGRHEPMSPEYAAKKAELEAMFAKEAVSGAPGAGETLLPCAYCGGPVGILEPSPGAFMWACTNERGQGRCGVSSGRLYDTREEAVAACNRRQPGAGDQARAVNEIMALVVALRPKDEDWDGACCGGLTIAEQKVARAIEAALRRLAAAPASDRETLVRVLVEQLDGFDSRGTPAHRKAYIQDAAETIADVILLASGRAGEDGR